VECSVPCHNCNYNSDEVEIAIELFERRRLARVNQIPAEMIKSKGKTLRIETNKLGLFIVSVVSSDLVVMSDLSSLSSSSRFRS
jgi:C4-type Zn-finger protein